MEAHLTRGAVAAIWEDAAAVAMAGVPPVLQVAGLFPWLHTPGGYAAMLSDGDYLIVCGLPPCEPSSVDVGTGRLRSGSVVRLPAFVGGRTRSGQRFIIARQLEVLQTDCLLIGNPKQYQPCQLEDKHEELNAQLVTSSPQLNIGAYSSGQCFKELLTRGMVAMLQQPVMQVVCVMRSELENFENFYLTLSDGVHTQNATLASHLNHLVKEGQLRYGTIVRIIEFTCNNLQSPSMIVVIQLEVLQIECELIGRPNAYELCCIGKPYGVQIKCGESYYESVADYAQPENAPYSGGTGIQWHLTQDAVVAMLESDWAVEQQLVMQVVDVSLACQTNYIYRILLSDGTYKEHAILFPNLNPLVEGGWLCNGTIVCILMWHCETSQNYRSIFVQLEVLQTKCELIGSPTFYEPGIRHSEVYADFSARSLPEQNDSMREDAASSGGQT